MKYQYEEPTIELLYLDETDVITLSNEGDDLEEGGDFPMPTDVGI